MVEQYSSFLDEKQRQRELLGGVASRQTMNIALCEIARIEREPRAIQFNDSVVDHAIPFLRMPLTT